MNGILQVEARDRVTGREHHEIVRTSGGLTAKEIEAARERITRNEDGWQLANLDERLRHALLSARQALERSRSKLDREETALVERTIRWAGSVLNTSSELVEGALLEMDDVLQRLARALLRPDDPFSKPE